MVKGCGDDTGDVFLDYPVPTRPGVHDVLFGVAQNVGDGLLVCPVDDRLSLRVGQSPGDRDTLGDAERQVEPGHPAAAVSAQRPDWVCPHRLVDAPARRSSEGVTQAAYR